MRRGPFDARRNALERHRQLLDPRHRQQLLEQPAKRLVGVQVRTGTRQRGHAPEQGPAERLAGNAVAPHLVEPAQRSRGIRRHEHTVDRTDRGAKDQVRPDPGLGERPEHADLIGPQDPATAEHERDLPPRRISHHQSLPRHPATMIPPRRTGLNERQPAGERAGATVRRLATAAVDQAATTLAVAVAPPTIRGGTIPSSRSNPIGVPASSSTVTSGPPEPRRTSTEATRTRPTPESPTAPATNSPTVASACRSTTATPPPSLAPNAPTPSSPAAATAAPSARSSRARCPRNQFDVSHPSASEGREVAVVERQAEATVGEF